MSGSKREGCEILSALINRRVTVPWGEGKRYGRIVGLYLSYHRGLFTKPVPMSLVELVTGEIVEAEATTLTLEPTEWKDEPTRWTRCDATHPLLE